MMMTMVMLMGPSVAFTASHHMAGPVLPFSLSINPDHSVIK